MLSRVILLILLAAVACVVPRTLSGQTEVVFDAGVGAFAGGDFAGTPAGPALGVALHIADWGSAQGGFELVYGRHGGRTAIESATTQLEYLGLVRSSVLSDPIQIHLGGKMGLGRRSLTIVDEPARADGFIIGPSAALRVPVGSLSLQLTVDALYATYEELVMYGRSEYGTDQDGLRLVLRAGLAFSLADLLPGTGPGDGPAAPAARGGRNPSWPPLPEGARRTLFVRHPTPSTPGAFSP